MEKGTLTVNQGLVNNPSRTTLTEGEVSLAVAAEYHIGSDEIHKQPGRIAAFTANTPANSILNLHRLRYEDSADVLVAATGNGDIWESSSLPAKVGMIWESSAALTGRSKTAIPNFNAFIDRWLICNGVDENQVREGANVPGTSSKYRTAGMKAALGQTALTLVNVQGNQATPDSQTGGWTNGANGSNADLTDYAIAQVSGAASLTHTWTFSTNLAQTDRVLRINHAGYGSYKKAGGILSEVRRDDNFGDVPDGSPPEGTSRATFLVEYSTDGGTTYTELHKSTVDYAQTTSTVNLADGLDFSSTNLIIRATITGQFGETSMRMFAVYVDTGGQTQKTILNNLRYFVTERYFDSDSIAYESLPTELSAKLTGTGYSVTVTLPTAAANSFATEWVIYRSIDESGGGYPFMWEVGKTPIAETTFIDDWSLSLTSVTDKTKLFDFITLLFYNGSQLDFPMNAPPPKSKMSINYQGSVVYIPVDIPRKVWYSIATAISAAAGERVPSPYNLEFLTSENDTVVSAALTNGGRSLVVYFDSYTMIVHTLPQAADPGRFDNRVRDYVSQSRGTAGTHTTTSFTPEDGSSTLAASADSLGLWITDGIGLIRNWSKDYDWEGAFASIDLSTAILINNPQMRRLELTYDTGGAWEDLHFFYGELKSNGQPKITGPTPIGYRCKTYAKVDGKWLGWSGDESITGAVWAERVGTNDASNGHDSDGNIPFQVESKDEYAFGLSDSALLTYIYPKFNERDLIDKDVTVQATCNRDGRSTAVISRKLHNLLTGKKVFYNKFADRFRILIEDISTTALPALLGMEYVARNLNAEGTQGDS